MLQLNYTDFDGFAEALQGVQGQYVLRARQQCDWRLRIVELDGVVVMAGRDGAANFYSGASSTGCFTAFVALRAHSAIVVNGQRFDPRTIAWLVSEQMFCMGADAPANWLSVTIQADIVDSWLAAHGYSNEATSLSRNFTDVANASVASLVWAARRLFSVAAQSPEDLQVRTAQATARRDIVDATLRAVLSKHEVRRAGRPAIDRSRILSHALELIETAGDEPVYTEDLCRTADVSERTLRNVFHKAFGIAPHQHLMLARLNRARTAIRSARPDVTLAGICTDLGFWDFGQFARRYREVFGVLPSQALAERRRVGLAS